MYTPKPAYPTVVHATAANQITEFFSKQPAVSAVLLTCSCARGQATADSCLDMAILVAPDITVDERNALATTWQRYHAATPIFAELQQVGRFSHVDLSFIDGQFDAAKHHHGWTTGADAFELEVGNYLAYSAPLWERDASYAQLKATWLPYYPESLRRERLSMVRTYCLNNLAHIPLYVERGLYFQAFRRLYDAFGEFLQVFFIARCIYPIAYDKWIQEQICDILQLPDLYAQLPLLFELHPFASAAIAHKGAALTELLEQYASADQWVPNKA